MSKFILKYNVKCLITFLCAVFALLCLVYMVFSAYTVPYLVKYFIAGFITFAIAFFAMLFTL